MSFWNFLGGLALFDMLGKWFSGKPKSHLQSSQPMYGYGSDAACSRAEQLNRRPRATDSHISDIDDYDIDELQERIDDLESRLDDCDIMSDRYDRIQSEIDMLQARLDDIDDAELYDDIHDDLYGLYDNDLYIDRDEDW